MQKKGKIGIFDSGYGGLTILKEIRKLMPGYDYIYLGDNARAPYGVRSFDLVYQFTLEAVKTLFERDCNLVILACNTASAKALRTIQQNDLPKLYPDRRVLGVIRPTVEEIPKFTDSNHVGVFATPGTVRSKSYTLETAKINPAIKITEQECPMWVPIIENGEADSPGADYFVKKYIDSIKNRDPEIDTYILGCTHYPILLKKILRFAPPGTLVMSQGEIVAKSLENYLQRHPEIQSHLSKNATLEVFTTETTEKFNQLASLFLSHPVNANHLGSLG